jgi:hypothetical protein
MATMAGSQGNPRREIPNDGRDCVASWIRSSQLFAIGAKRIEEFYETWVQMGDASKGCQDAGVYRNDAAESSAYQKAEDQKGSE